MADQTDTHTDTRSPSLVITLISDRDILQNMELDMNFIRAQYPHGQTLRQTGTACFIAYSTLNGTIIYKNKPHSVLKRT